MNLNLNNLKMPGGQAPPAVSGPLLPTQAVFRQKPWLPWWVAIVIPLLALLALLLFLFLPKNVEVPDVVGKKSAFEAEKAITEAGLKLAPATKEKVEREAAPRHRPEPDAEGRRDSGEGVRGHAARRGRQRQGERARDRRPDERRGGEDAARRGPFARPGDAPARRSEGEDQEPGPGREGDPQPRARRWPSSSRCPAPPRAKGAGTAPLPPAAVAAGGGGGEAEGGSLKVPEIDGAARAVYAKKVGDEGLIPKVVKKYDEKAEKGAIFRVVPEPGTEVETGSDVTVFVSAGFPKLAFDNDRDVLVANGVDGSDREPIAKGSQEEKDPTWSLDGSAVAYTSDGQVFLRNLTDPDASPQALTKADEDFRDLAWAPTANTLAMIKDGGGTTAADAQSSLCFGAIDASGMRTRCMAPSDILLGRKVNWGPDGKSLLVVGQSRDASQLGMVRFRSRRAFSADPADWQSQGFKTDTTKPRTGVLDAAISPDGKQLAAVVLAADGTTDLFLGKPDNLLLSDAKPVGVRACKVIWRPDGEQLVVVRADDCLGSTTGELLRLSVADPRSDQDSLGLTGDNPTFQPLAAE